MQLKSSLDRGHGTPCWDSYVHYVCLLQKCSLKASPMRGHLDACHHNVRLMSPKCFSLSSSKCPLAVTEVKGLLACQQSELVRKQPHQQSLMETHDRLQKYVSVPISNVMFHSNNCDSPLDYMVLFITNYPFSTA